MRRSAMRCARKTSGALLVRSRPVVGETPLGGPHLGAAGRQGRGAPVKERMRLLTTTVLFVFATSCHPLACFHPADLPRDRPQILVSNDAFPKADVEIDVDDLGIPHIYGQSEADVAYALGVMHGRDRLFQIYLYVHAGEGRLTELLGAEYLEIDRQNRLLMHGADEQLTLTQQRDLDIMTAYVAGVNESAKTAGRSAEMSILGVDWEPITVRSVLAIVRLQQWDQGIGFSEEIARFRLAKQTGLDSPVARALFASTPSGGVPIVGVAEHDGAAFVSGASSALHAPPPTSGPRMQPVRGGGAALLRAMKDEIAARFLQGGTGASNSWSVGPEHTATGVAVLANDPHLSHAAPGVFYLVDMHLEGASGAFTIAGGTFPGIPAVLIGHGNDIAWGVTNAYADTQDIVVLQTRADGNYVVDGTAHSFNNVTQRFKLGKGDDAKVIEETWQTSIFGPVLPPGYGSYGGVRPLVDEGEHLALLWTATTFPLEHARFASAFWDLAKSANVEEATEHLQDFSAPAMSVNMAFTNGTIAYRLSGIIPVRGDAQRTDYPRLGTSRAAGWSGRLPAAQKPQATNPAKGYIVASNQRVVEDGVLSQAVVGFEGAQPWRALRIDRRVRELIADGKKATTEDLLAIQQDITAGDTQELAGILGVHCSGPIEGHDDARVRAFCDAVASFDGVYTVDALAIPYARLVRELRLEVLRAHVDADLADDLAGQSFAQMAIHQAIKDEDAGSVSPLFDEPSTAAREGLDGFMSKALKTALDVVVAEAGGGEGDWRWGKLHTLSLRGVLAGAPVIGFMFQTSAQQEAGTGTAPRAESADFNNKLRVQQGAGLRLIAEMTDPPTIRMINDSGQSGHFGHRHLEDQRPLWSKGEPRVLALSKADAQGKREGAMLIKPKR